MSRPLCSIVIPVFNHASLTRQCLEHLLAEEHASCRVEIVVVDDASTDLTPEVLAGYRDRITAVRRPVNGGFARASNDGARAASGEPLVFLNNDTLAQPGWLDALVRHAEAHPRAGVVGGKLLFPDGTVQHAGVVVTGERGVRHVYAGFPGDNPAVCRPRRFQAVTAACALVRREAFEAAGGFDTSYTNGLEDADLCLRLGKLGWEVWYCPDCVVWHLESVSRRGRHDLENSLFFFERWGEEARPDDLETYREDGLLDVAYERPLFPISLHVSPRLAAIDSATRQD